MKSWVFGVLAVLIYLLIGGFDTYREVFGFALGIITTVAAVLAIIEQDDIQVE